LTSVLDASAAIELVMARPAQHRVAAILQESDWVLAPSLFIYEVANTLWKYHRLLKVQLKELEARLRQAVDIVDEFLGAEDLLPEALRLSSEIGQPVYDAVYLVASRRRKAFIISMDRRITDAATRLGIETAAV
jgi:predicted nucleic acid-binding protein